MSDPGRRPMLGAPSGIGAFREFAEVGRSLWTRGARAGLLRPGADLPLGVSQDLVDNAACAACEPLRRSGLVPPRFARRRVR